MASIYKKARDKDKKGACWYITYTDANGKRRNKKGFTDKRATEELAQEVEVRVRRQKEGLEDPAEVLLRETLSSDCETHLKKFEASLEGANKRYIALLLSRIRTVFKGCNFGIMKQLDGENAEAFLRKLKTKNGFGNKTYNHYVQGLGAFGNWCVQTGRLKTNPFLRMKRLNTEVDIRHKRRALTPEEITKLVGSARKSRTRIQGFTGEQRARIYILSYMTGLRRNELGSLTPGNFKLDSNPPTLSVEAAFSKHRKKDTLPLHPELAEMLHVWLDGVKPGEPLFPRLGKRQTHVMVRKDLERVGIAYENEDGIADFHAAGRHSHITALLRSGSSLVEARELARHSDIRMTMRYTHIGIEDQARAVSQLPWTAPGTAEPDTQKADDRSESDKSGHPHGTGTGRAEGQNESSDGTELTEEMVSENGSKPCGLSTFGNKKKLLTPSGINSLLVGMTGIEPARPKGTRS